MPTLTIEINSFTPNKFTFDSGLLPRNIIGIEFNAVLNATRPTSSGNSTYSGYAFAHFNKAADLLAGLYTTGYVPTLIRFITVSQSLVASFSYDLRHFLTGEISVTWQTLLGESISLVSLYDTTNYSAQGKNELIITYDEDKKE